MFKCSLVIFLFGSYTFAFDPFSAAVAADSVKNVIDKADETADIGFSLLDLLKEIGVETDSEDDLEAAMDRLHRFSSEANDLKYKNDSLSQNIDTSLNKGASLSRRIKALRNTVKLSKQLAQMFGLRPKAAEKAIKVQDIKLSSMILEELQSIRRAQYLSILEDKEYRIKRDIVLERLIEDSKEKLNLKSNRSKIGGS